jgi:hypothetical protein
MVADFDNKLLENIYTLVVDRSRSLETARVFYFKQMDKLQWFKFTISDWVMGKIMRCPEVTQARFIWLCCQYWNKECVMNYDDAELEIEKEHLTILLQKRIILLDGDYIKIKFLDSQLIDILEVSKGRSIAAKAKWDKFYDKKTDANAMQVYANAEQMDASAKQNSASAMQNDADKIRVDKKRIYIPSLSEVELYFKDNGYTKESAIKAYNFYDVANWVDSKGNKVKNWKQKMQGVWFKDENKAATLQYIDFRPGN